jgi:hypothetical protein
VNLDSRDYEQILDALPGILEQVDPDSFRITIVGGGRDRALLEASVADRGLEDQFLFADLNEDGFVPGGPYYQHLLGAAFVLPLIPAYAPAFRTFKITSAIQVAVGIGVPPVIDKWTATVYDVPGVVYKGAAVGQGLARALTMGQDEVAALRAAMEAQRERELARSAAEMAWSLASVGLRP